MITFKVYQAKAVGRGKGKWRWTATHKNGNKLADSGEGLVNKADALKVLNGFLNDIRFQRFSVEMPKAAKAKKRCGPKKRCH